jgi:hypothetical protein
MTQSNSAIVSGHVSYNLSTMSVTVSPLPVAASAASPACRASHLQWSTSRRRPCDRRERSADSQSDGRLVQNVPVRDEAIEEQGADAASSDHGRFRRHWFSLAFQGSVAVVSLTIAATWVASAASTASVTSPSAPRTTAGVTSTPAPRTTTEALDAWPVDSVGRTITDMGCARDLSAASLDTFFSSQIGPLVGWDNPHIYKIDDHRTLWIAHDSYVDYDGDAPTLGDTRPQMQNVVFLQEGPCFRLVHGGTDTEWSNFEAGDGHAGSNRFLWPLGGALDGRRIWILWSEMVPSPEPIEPWGGIARHPVATWLASYDVDTLERLSFAPAPESGVFPIWGFAVESDNDYSYLFGNTNLLNFTRAGGFDNGPHSATKMLVARVPKGRLDLQPAFWNGSHWTSDASQAAVISERFWAENTMQPRYLNDQWVSVVKRDGFFGNEIVIDVAENPWGPWIEVERIPHEGRPGDIAKNSYHPVVLPSSSPAAGLVVLISENAQQWSEAVDRLDLYRPTIVATGWPFVDELIGSNRSNPPDS